MVPPATTVILILVLQRRRNPTNDRIDAASPPFSSPSVAIAQSSPSRSPMAPSWTSMRHRRPPVRHGECRSRPGPPFRKTGQLRQCRHHGRRDASVSSPAAGVRPSLLGPPPPVGRRRRQHGEVDARPCQPGDAITTPCQRRPTFMVISVVRWVVGVRCGCVGVFLDVTDSCVLWCVA